MAASRASGKLTRAVVAGALICAALSLWSCRDRASGVRAAPGPAGAPPQAGDWPCFRGPGQQGVSAEARLPLTWSADRNIVWKSDIPGPGASSPIVAGQRVFLTCYTGYGVPGQRRTDSGQLKRHILSLSLSDGKPVWQKEVESALPEQASVSEHGYATSTPVVEGDRLYAFFGKSGVFAFDLEGRQIWRASVGDGVHQWGSASSPVLYKDLVIVNAAVESGSVVALSKETGREVWRAGGIRQSWASPQLVGTADGKTELVIGIEGKLLGFDPATGEMLWTCGGPGGYFCPTPVTQQGVIYAVWGSRTMGVRAGGRGDVSRTHQLWNIWRSSQGSLVSSAVFHQGNLYFASDRSGTVFCMNGQTSEILGQRQLAPAPGKIYSSMLLAGGRLYVTARSGTTYVLGADPQLEQLAANDLNDGSIFDASPAVTGRRLLIRSGRCLYCVGE